VTTHLSLLLRVRMNGAIPLFPLYVFMMWTGATSTVVKKYGGTRNNVLWTAGHQLLTTKVWIQQQRSRIESFVEKEVSLLEYLISCTQIVHLMSLICLSTSNATIHSVYKCYIIQIVFSVLCVLVVVPWSLGV
jgi:hypothetical protein